MAVSGVRKSCVTESSRMERRRSLSRLASECGKLLHRSGALDGDRDQAADRVESLRG